MRSAERRSKDLAYWHARGGALRKERQLSVDVVVVDRLVNGEPLSDPATCHERRAAFELLRNTDLTNAQMALRLRCSERTIERYRKAAL